MVDHDRNLDILGREVDILGREVVRDEDHLKGHLKEDEGRDHTVVNDYYGGNSLNSII